MTNSEIIEQLNEIHENSDNLTFENKLAIEFSIQAIEQFDRQVDVCENCKLWINKECTSRGPCKMYYDPETAFKK